MKRLIEVIGKLDTDIDRDLFVKTFETIRQDVMHMPGLEANFVQIKLGALFGMTIPQSEHLILLTEELISYAPMLQNFRRIADEFVPTV